jgi:hypothetical protein
MKYERPAIESKSDVRGVMTFGGHRRRRRGGHKPKDGGGGGYR